MESPEPGSPDSGSSSDSPPAEEFPSTLALKFRPAPESSRFTGAKRRFGSGAASSARDAKSRRRDEPGPSRKQGPPFGEMGFGSQMGPSKKEELIDVALVDHLRIRFGDPFDERALKEAS